MSVIALTRSQALALAAMIKDVSDVNTMKIRGKGGYDDIRVTLYSPSRPLDMDISIRGVCTTVIA